MFLQKISTPGLAVQTYIIADTTAKQAVVIDPVRDIESLIKILSKESFEVTHILETHVHADFVSGSKELQQFLGHGCRIACSSMGGPEWVPRYAQLLVQDHDVIRIGSVRLVARHTPGHTPEHLIWVVYDEKRHPKIPTALLSGDLVFVGSVGRPDLLGPKIEHALAHQLYHSLFKLLPELPDYVELFPAHGAGSLCGKDINVRESSTVGYERLANPALSMTNETVWVKKLMQDMPPAPDYFQRIKRINVEGAPLLVDLHPPAHLSLEQVAALDPQEVFICDVRMPEEFAQKHLPRSVNIPLRPSAFAGWAAQVIPYDQPLYLLVKDHDALKPVLSALHLVGLDQVVGYAVVDEAALAAYRGTLHAFPIWTPAQAVEMAQEGCVLDVRTVAERKAHGYIDGSLAIELGTLQKQLDQVPRDACVATVCRSGFRASIAASLLRRAGFQNVANIGGGMEEWSQARLPVVSSEPVS